jgi:alpha-methylacyl-CoA racemase
MTAGHDIDYLAVSGTLDAIGRSDDRPVPPLNLVADFGGGGMLMAYGITCGLLEAQRSGRGQVVDAAMVDGAALLAAMIYGMRAAGLWDDARGSNLIDTGAPFYEVYETADGGHLAVGAIEPQFYAELVAVLGLAEADLPPQMDRDAWPGMKKTFADAVRARTLDEWVAVSRGTDACMAPVVPMASAATHPHNAARGTFTTVAGIVQPSPAPRFSRTPAGPVRPPTTPGRDTSSALVDWGIESSRVEALLGAGVLSGSAPTGEGA